ncbi:MAG: hypothetical protein ACOY4I_05935 [Bacillota bacterium]
MKIIAVSLTICLILAGCVSNKAGNEFTGSEREVLPVVEKYLENAAAGNWNEVFDTLSGEALAEARANSKRVEAKEKIIARDMKATPLCKDIVEVSVDFTRNTGNGFDRLAYSFRLKKSGQHWRIYKTTPGEYHHGDLRPGELPLKAAETITTYLELPPGQKRNMDHEYLAGRLLQESNRAKLLPADPGQVKEQEKISARVKAMQCMGISEGYVVALVIYESIRDGRAYPMEALVEMLDVNGTWKICRLDITGI